MKRPRIVFGTAAAVAASCRRPNLACTVVNTDFYGQCTPARGQWAVTPHLIATLSIFTTSDRLLEHELGHINDIHHSLNVYAASLLVRSFPTEQACTAFVFDEAKSFSHVMKAIQHATAVQRDGVQFAGPAE